MDWTKSSNSISIRHNERLVVVMSDFGVAYIYANFFGLPTSVIRYFYTDLVQTKLDLEELVRDWATF